MTCNWMHPMGFRHSVLCARRLLLWQETYHCVKRPACVRRLVDTDWKMQTRNSECCVKRDCRCEKRPIFVKRDHHCGKRPIFVKTQTRNSECCVKRDGLCGKRPACARRLVDTDWNPPETVLSTVYCVKGDCHCDTNRRKEFWVLCTVWKEIVIVTQKLFLWKKTCLREKTRWHRLKPAGKSSEYCVKGDCHCDTTPTFVEKDPPAWEDSLTQTGKCRRRILSAVWKEIVVVKRDLSLWKEIIIVARGLFLWKETCLREKTRSRWRRLGNADAEFWVLCGRRWSWWQKTSFVKRDLENRPTDTCMNEIIKENFNVQTDCHCNTKPIFVKRDLPVGDEK